MATKRPVPVPSSPAPMDIGAMDATGMGLSHTLQMLAKFAEAGHRSGDLVNRRLIKAQCVTIIEDDAAIHVMCVEHPLGVDYARALIAPVTGQ